MRVDCLLATSHPPYLNAQSIRDGIGTNIDADVAVECGLFGNVVTLTMVIVCYRRCALAFSQLVTVVSIVFVADPLPTNKN